MSNQNLSCTLNSPSWTTYEHKLQLFRASQCNDVVLQKAIGERMRESTLCDFLYHLNRGQLQQAYVQEDKLDRVRFDMGKQLVNLEKLERLDDFCEDLLGLIDQLLRHNPTGKITVKSVLGNLNVLRLTGSKISSMDDTLSGLSDLHALVLAGNCLSSCPGSGLPKSLLVLELCCNNLQDITTLAEDAPPHLLYLGLARNFLTHDKLRTLQRFRCLYHLDLAHNNIEDLSEVIDSCSQLENLSSLMLIGNPCSMAPNYLIFIIRNLPKLYLLDGEILGKVKSSAEDEFEAKLDLKGTLEISLFRIMGFPQPPNQKINKKKVIHSFRVELDCPLLQPYLSEWEESFVVDSSVAENDGEAAKQDKTKNLDTTKGGKTTDEKLEGNPKKKKKSKDEKPDEKVERNPKKKKKSEDKKPDEKLEVNSKKKKKSSNKTPGEQPEKNSKKKKTSSGDIEEKATEEVDSAEKQEAELYESELKSDQINSEACFVSEKKNWGKIIEFNEPTIQVLNCDLPPLRDVFRSNLSLRIVHIKTLPPATKPKGKQKKQEKAKKNSQETDISDKETNKEILVSKSTVAKIKIPLQDVMWNVKYLEYAWTKTKPLKVELSPGLKESFVAVLLLLPPHDPPPCVATASNKTKFLSVASVEIAKTKKGKEEVKSGELPIPTELTCHLGIGVRREEIIDVLEI